MAMETDFDRVLDALPCLVWTWGADGCVEYLNEGWRAYTGMAADTLALDAFHATIHADDREKVRSAFAAIQASNHILEIEARLRRDDGQYRWFALRLAPMQDKAGGTSQWCGIATFSDEKGPDIGDRNIPDQRLLRFLNSIPTQVVFFSANHELEFVNDDALTYYGKTLDDLRDWFAAGVVHPEDVVKQHERSEIRDRLAAITAAGGPGYVSNGRMRRHDGVYRWFRSTLVQSRDAGENIVRYVCVRTDIDDLKRAEELLSGEVELLKMAARGSPLQEVLDALCRLVGAMSPGSHCSILGVEIDKLIFRAGAGPSLPESYNKLFDGKAVDPGYGPCSLAAVQQAPVITVDPLQDPRWVGSWPPLMESMGFRSCWSTPIQSSAGGVIGVFALYKHDTTGPTPLEQELVDRFTNIAAMVIERAQADAALQQSEARKAAILDTALDCVVSIDHKGAIKEFNPAAEQTFGYSREQALKLRLSDLVLLPEGEAAIADPLGSAAASLLGKRIELTAIHANGTRFPAEFSMTRIAQNGPPSFSAYIRDITERVRASEDLQRANRFLVETQRLTLTASFTWDFERNEHIWSEENYRIFEFDPASEVTLERILPTIHPDDLPDVEALLGRAQNGEDFELAFRLIPASGRIKYAHVVGRRVDHVTDRPVFMGATQDVTARKLTEEALNRARSELTHMARVTTLGALTASIAHEVSQPLSGIITNASACLRVLATDPPDIEKALATARRTIRDGNRASEVIKRLRAMFAAEPFRFERVDLHEAVREVLALSSGEMRSNGAFLRTEFAARSPVVMGDRVQLQQVVLNLVLNAVDAMSGVEDRPRILTVSTANPANDRIELAVCDTGTGLDDETIEKLFDAFYTTKPKGMGVGLAISRSIAENHGGRLSAAANRLVGATFCFSIPTTSSQ